MRLPPERGIGYIDTTQADDFQLDQVRETIADIYAGTPLSPDRADQFLETDFNGAPTRMERWRGGPLPAAALISASAAVKAALQIDPHVPTLGRLPHNVHVVLNTAWDYLPIGNVEAPTPDVVQHVPGLLLAVGLADGVRRIYNYRTSRNLNSHARDAQDALRDRVDAGTQPWDLSGVDNPTVAFVGNGMTVPRSIARNGDDRVVQVSYKPVKGVNVVLPQDASVNESLVALERANVLEANQILIFPNTAKDEIFSPSGVAPDAYDMSVDRTEANIKRIDWLCDKHGVTRKQVIVIGNKMQSVAYITAANSTDFSSNRTEEFLIDRMNNLAYERDCPITVIDTTDVVVDAAVRLAESRPMVFSGTEESVRHFAASFFGALSTRVDPDPTAPPVRFIYNINDRSTQALAQPDDISVIRDPSRREALVENGVPPGRVLVVAELVRAALSDYLDGPV